MKIYAACECEAQNRKTTQSLEFINCPNSFFPFLNFVNGISSIKKNKKNEKILRFFCRIMKFLEIYAIFRHC